MTQKIAAVTDDGQKLSSHFGMAPAYIVYTITDGQVVTQEERSKPHHGDHPHGEHRHGDGHGCGGRMYTPISDCQVLLCGGMGAPAYQKAQSVGLEVFMTGGAIADALQTYLAGTLVSDMRRVHSR